MKRPWITLLALVFVFAALLATGSATRAVEVQTGGESQAVVPPRPAPSPPPPAAQEERALRKLIASVEIGAPKHCDGFSVYPLRLDSPLLGTRVVTLDEALKDGTLTITEQGGGNVPILLASNSGKRHVFLMAGEMILGGKQNRIVRQDMLVPPGAARIEVPVYCGQQGRWHVTSSEFQSEKTMASFQVRKSTIAQEGQGKVWSEIDENLKSNAAADTTGALQAAYDKPEVKKRIRTFTACRPAGGKPVAGVVVTRAGRVLGADLFGDHRTYDALVEKVLTTYAVEVFEKEAKRGADRTAVEEFLAGLTDAEFEPLTAYGAGRSFAIRDGAYSGGGLAIGNEPVHVAVVR